MSALALSADELRGLREDLALALPDLCAIERDASQDAPTDAYGHAPAPEWVPHLVAQPCSYWQADGSTSTDPVEVVTYRHRLALPYGTDVRATDRVREVTDAAGQVRTDGVLRVDAVVRFPSHVELGLVELSW